MSKKSNTLWFILGATAFNVLTTLIAFFLLLYVFFILLEPFIPGDSEALGTIRIIIVIGGAIAISFFLYKFILKLIMKKYDLEQHLDPIFGPRRRK